MPFEAHKITVNQNKIQKDVQKLAQLTAPITTAAKAYVEADVSVTPGSNTYSLIEQKDNFARVNVAPPEGSGYALILKQMYDIWVVVAAGQDKPGKAIGQKYGLPAGWFSTEY